jgi:hypothetical protein
MLLVVSMAAIAGPVVVARWALAQAAADPLDPVRVAGDTHRLAFENAFGTFAWNEAIVHSVENVGRTEGHILRIELKL